MTEPTAPSIDLAGLRGQAAIERLRLFANHPENWRHIYNLAVSPNPCADLAYDIKAILPSLLSAAEREKALVGALQRIASTPDAALGHTEAARSMRQEARDALPTNVVHIGAERAR